MLSGAHILLYSKDPAADRAFLQDVLGLKGIDIGHGWVICKLPPAEIAVHPADGPEKTEMYFMTDDLDALLAKLGLADAPVHEERWGKRASIRLPSGMELGVYQPYHPTALAL